MTTLRNERAAHADLLRGIEERPQRDSPSAWQRQGRHERIVSPIALPLLVIVCVGLVSLIVWVAG